jgi:hypothetical protein
MPVLALLGANALWYLYLWLLSAIIAGAVAGRKGYAERFGVGAGMILPWVGVVLWLLWPAKPESKWKTQGPIPIRRKRVRPRGGS